MFVFDSIHYWPVGIHQNASNQHHTWLVRNFQYTFQVFSKTFFRLFFYT